MRKVLFPAIAVLLVGAVYLAINAAVLGGFFDDLEPTLVERCERIEVAPGTEDLTFNEDTGSAYVSSTDRRKQEAGVKEQGGIYLVDPADAESVRHVSPDAPKDFRPHGIDLWTGPDGTQRLFAVNHPHAGGHFIEVFDVVDGGVLKFVETIGFDEMFSPNDVVGVGPRSFYVTNDHGYEGGFMGFVENILAVPFASAAYFDGKQGRLVAKNLSYANGINVSADGRTVYVAEVLGRRVSVFDRDVASGDLELNRRLPVGTAPDNIEIAADGALWIGAHPRVYDFLAHAADENVSAPSHVVRVDPDSGETKTVFLSLEGEISGAATGAVHGDWLLVGSIYESHVLRCPL